MATKLKNMHLTSVDLVRAGANQEADICLHKSADDNGEIGLFKRFMNWLHGETEVEKAGSTFGKINQERDSNDKLWRYSDALQQSLFSIRDDETLSVQEKKEMMTESLAEYSEAMGEVIDALASSGCAGCTGEVVCAAKSLEDVEKYNHYHGPDGKFTTASGGIAHSTISNGGSTTNLRHGTSLKTGYTLVVKEDVSRGQQVSINKYWNKKKKREAISKALDSFMEKNKDVLKAGKENGKHMGTWFDTKTGVLWLDISTNFKSKSDAIKAANEAGEIAIWDAAAGEEIRLRDKHE